MLVTLFFFFLYAAAALLLLYVLWHGYVFLHRVIFPFKELGTIRHPQPPTGFTVAIIGTGLSGIQSLKQCIADGLSPTCFDADSQAGGLWRFKSDNTFPSVYRSTHIDTGRDLNSFGDRPYSTKEPIVIHNSRVVSYLRENIEEFGLEKYMRFNTRVEYITPTPDGKKWRLDISSTTSGDAIPKKESLTFDGVLICSGRHGRCYYPKDIEGQEKYKGTVLHSSEYKDPAAHSLGKESVVAVVGIGNSGCDIVTELAQHVKHCFLVSRSGSWVFDTKGTPLNSLGPGDRLFGTLLSRMPWQFTSTQVEKLFGRGVFGDQAYLNECGLKPEHRVMQAHPTATGIADPTHTLHSEMKLGHISVKRGIKKFVGDYGIVFSEVKTDKDSSKSEEEKIEKVDAVIFATGYRQACDFIDPAVIDLRYDRKGNDVPLYFHMFPISERCPQTLAFINFVQAASFMNAELQSRVYTAVVRKEVTLPPEKQRRREVKATAKTQARQWVDRPRHKIQGALSLKHYDRLAKFIGCYPDFWKIVRERPSALSAAWFEPITGLQYRLVGRGRIEQAEKWIKERHRDLRVGHIPSKVPYAVQVLGLLLLVSVLWLRGDYVGGLQYRPDDWAAILKEEEEEQNIESKKKL